MAITQFARGTRALGICDRCGLTFKLNALKYEVTMRRRTGLRVCESCNDPDHPQSFIGELTVVDPQALRDPRPDNYIRGAATPTAQSFAAFLAQITGATAALTTPVAPLAAAIRGVATLTGTFSAASQFVAAPTSTATLTADLKARAALAGGASGGATLSGTLTSITIIQRATEAGTLRISEDGTDVVTEESP